MTYSALKVNALIKMGNCFPVFLIIHSVYELEAIIFSSFLDCSFNEKKREQESEYN